VWKKYVPEWFIDRARVGFFAMADFRYSGSLAEVSGMVFDDTFIQRMGMYSTVCTVNVQ